MTMIQINGVTGETWTYSDVREKSIIMSKALYGAGLRQNDVISVISENRFEFLPISYGALFINVIVAPLNITYTRSKLSKKFSNNLIKNYQQFQKIISARVIRTTLYFLKIVKFYILFQLILFYIFVAEIEHSFKLSKPKFVFTSKTSINNVKNAASKFPFIERIINIDEELDDFVSANENKNFDVEKYATKKVQISDQTAFIMMSSGTTGLQKAVQQTHENVLSVIQCYREIFVLFRMVHELKYSVVLNVTPWFHGFGFISKILIIASRQDRLVFLPKFQEKDFYHAIEKFRVNILTLVPPIMVLLAKSTLFDKYDLSSVKDIGCGAAHLSREIEEQVKTRFKGEVTIRQGYGLTEATFGTLTGVLNLKPGSVGQVVKGVYAKVIDEKGNILGPNQIGELCFKSLRVMKGYIDNKKATDEMIDNEGWLHTGDLGYYDQDLQFFIVDRLKELIKYKGFQVAPAELETILLTHKKILDCGVIGVPDEIAGELPMAFVVKKPGESLSEKEVQNFIENNANKIMWLRGGVKFVDEIPKNASGKILRRELRDLYKSSKSKL